VDTTTAATLVIAVATVATGLATWATFFIGWKAWRQQQADRRPIIELRYNWEDGSLTARITIRNRLHEAIVVERARVKRPRRALLTMETWYDSTGGEGGYKRATVSEIPIGRNVAPVGTRPATDRSGYQFAGTAADETIRMSIQFPSAWAGGWLRMDLRIASASDHRRGRWVKKSWRIPPPPPS
jgi:hypothetical protein